MTLGLLPNLRCTTAVALAALLGMGTAAAQAQDRLALVLGTTVYKGQKLPEVRTDTAAVSRKLLVSGFDVIRREDAAVRDLSLTRRAATDTLLYFSGQTAQTAEDILLLTPNGSGPAGGWPLLATLRQLRQSGAERVVAVIENCHVPPQTAPIPAAQDPVAPPPAALDAQDLPSAIFVAMTGAPDQPCAPLRGAPRLTDQLLAALSGQDAEAVALLSAAAGSGLILNTFAPGSALGLAASAQTPPTPSEQPLVISPASPIASPVQITSVSPVIDPVMRPITSQVSDPVVTAVDQGRAIVQPVANTGGAVRIIDVSPQSLQAALPTPAGLPRPSIIVGEIRPQNASFTPTEDEGALTGTALDATGYEAREQIRSSDAALFARLVSDGAFDPDALALPAALQTALQRMGCYTAQIDGDWGNGSRAAVDRYYAARGSVAPEREPTTALFRDVILREDVVCPVAQPAPATAAAPRATGGTARTPQAAATPRQPQRQPQPAAPATNRPRTIDPGALGSGVFR